MVSVTPSSFASACTNVVFPAPKSPCKAIVVALLSCKSLAKFGPSKILRTKSPSPLSCTFSIRAVYQGDTFQSQGAEAYRLSAQARGRGSRANACAKVWSRVCRPYAGCHKRRRFAALDRNRRPQRRGGDLWPCWQTRVSCRTLAGKPQGKSTGWKTKRARV